MRCPREPSDKDMVPGLISIIIPTRNRPKLLATAVTSILSQTYQSSEIILVDDGSSPAITPLPDWPADRVRIIRHDTSIGVAQSRNDGLAIARGEFLAFLDDDDHFLPGKLSDQVTYLRANPEVDIVFSKVQVVDASGDTRYHLTDQYEHQLLRNFRHFNVIHTNSVLMRRRVRTHIAFDSRLQKYTDMQYFLAATLTCRIHFLPIAVAVWNHRQRSDQLSRVKYGKNYRNFKLICDIFRETISEHPILIRRYYGRLAFQAIRSLKGWGFCQALWRLLSEKPRKSSNPPRLDSLE